MKWILSIIDVSGLASFAIGLTTVLGYKLGFENLYRWNDGVGMALNTGIAFMVVGVGLCLGTLVYAIRNDKAQ